MKIVIAGAGSVGRSVALELLAHGHDITLIDKLPEKLRIATVADADWVLADACSPDALRDADVEDADVVVAATTRRTWSFPCCPRRSSRFRAWSRA